MTIDLKQNMVFLKGYQKESRYRLAFNQLAMKIFDLSFEDWYQAGYWNEKYIPYTLFKDTQAIANVSVNIIDFEVSGEKVRTVQLGTVMTDPDYRNQQLNRFLMEQVLEDWETNSSFIYLYANPTVLEFYPKFGFSPAEEYVHSGTVLRRTQPTAACEKLDMNRQEHRDLLYHHVRHSASISKISMHDNNDLVMFYAISELKDSIYYLPYGDILAVATVEDQALHLWDVFGQSLQHSDLDKIINIIGPLSINKIIFGFTPLDCSAYQVRQQTGGDTLFIRNRHNSILVTEPLMFPLLSHA